MSKKIRAKDLIAQFRKMYEEKWGYRWGAAMQGSVDCSGAFVYAYRALDGPAIEHGSNTIARKRVGKIVPIQAAKPGWAAFKVYGPGNEGYALPDKFRPGRAGYTGDPLDYYHIGLIDETGKYVLNAKSMFHGFARDELRTFSYAAPLLDVDYGEEGEKMEDAKALWTGVVETDSGPLNLRKGPGTTSEVIAQIPRGTQLYVLGEAGAGLEEDGWLYVEYGGLRGYVSAYYVARMEAPDAPAAEPEDDGAKPYIVLTDEEGNRWIPVGEYTSRIEWLAD